MTGLLTLLVVFASAAALALAVQAATLADGRPLPWPQRIPFLGGGEPATHAWGRYHVRYYPMTLLFIAFEMEMMFMYPWAVVYAQEGLKALVEMGIFLMILSVGIVFGGLQLLP